MSTAEIIIPHWSTPLTDAALKLCIQAIEENSTASDFDLSIYVQSEKDKRCPYRKINEAAVTSTSDILVFLNNDMVVAPGWDRMIMHCGPDTICTGYLIECGAVPVNPMNVEQDYGRNAETFRRGDFETAAAALATRVADVVDGQHGWYMPMAIRRDTFLAMNGYNTRRGKHPDPLDILFWQHCAQHGVRHKRVNSWCYHFQRLSERANG